MAKKGAVKKGGGAAEGPAVGTEGELPSTAPRSQRSQAPRSHSTSTPAPASSAGAGVDAAPTPLGAPGTPVASNGLWRAELLQACQRMSPTISSVQGHEKSKEFRDYLREQGGPSRLIRTQGELEAVKATWRTDPDAFRKLLSRSDMRDYETVEAPAWLVLLEYLLTLSTALALGLWASQPRGSTHLRWLPVLVCLLAQLHAWSQGSGSAHGRLMGLILVREGRRGQTCTATLLQALFSQAAELLYLAATCGLGLPASVVLLLCVPRQRRPAGQLFAGVYAVRETSVLTQLASPP